MSTPANGERVASTLQEILEVEQHPLFAETVCPATGVLAWPAARNVFFRLILSDRLYSSQPLLEPGRRPPPQRVAGVALRAAVHNLLHRPEPSPVLIHATGAGLVESAECSSNRYTAGFCAALGSGHWSIEGLFDYEWPRPRQGGRLSFSLPASLAFELAGRVGVTAGLREIAGRITSLAARRAEELLGWRLGEQRQRWLSGYLARKLATYPARKRWFGRWLDRVGPRLLLTEEGCYGHFAPFNAVARERGVVIAEFQHGLVTGGHDVYNVAPVLADSPLFQNTLPDYFLAYGEWWTRQFNTPTKKIAIGSPHRDSAPAPRPHAAGGRTTVLVLGDGTETQMYLEACRELGRLLAPDQRLVFRPHPSERARVLASRREQLAGFELDEERDILPSLANADAVVGEISTGMFEAVGLAERIFIWRTPKSRFALPEHPFIGFESFAELAELIREGRGAGPGRAPRPEEIWAPDWRRRFLEFAGPLLGQRGGG